MFLKKTKLLSQMFSNLGNLAVDALSKQELCVDANSAVQFKLVDKTRF